MNRFYQELNAVIAIAARDVICYVRVPGAYFSVSFGLSFY
jgi:hypothetical protein